MAPRKSHRQKRWDGERVPSYFQGVGSEELPEETEDVMGFAVSRDWCGVRNGRRSSPFERFGDANREAMKACGQLGVTVRVLFLGTNEVVAEYVPGSQKGLVQSVSVGG
jgi:hypothetical protein